MKRISLLLLLICFLGGSLFSIEWGFKFGMGFSDMNIKETLNPLYEDFQFNTTELFAAFVSFKLSENLSVSPEINYLLMGGKIKRDIVLNTESGPAEIKDRLKWSHYTIHFPLIFKFQFSPKKSASPTFFAGPYVSVIVDSSWISDSIAGSYYDRYLEENEKLQTLDYGAVFGLGLDIKLDRFVAFLEMRYMLGLRNLAKPDNEAILNFSNRGFFINFGILFGRTGS